MQVAQMTQMGPEATVATSGDKRKFAVDTLDQFALSTQAALASARLA